MRPVTEDPAEVHAWDPDEAAARASTGRGRREDAPARGSSRGRLAAALLVGLLVGLAVEHRLGLLRGLLGG